MLSNIMQRVEEGVLSKMKNSDFYPDMELERFKEFIDSIPREQFRSPWLANVPLLIRNQYPAFAANEYSRVRISIMLTHTVSKFQDENDDDQALLAITYPFLSVGYEKALELWPSLSTEITALHDLNAALCYPKSVKTVFAKLVGKKAAIVPSALRFLLAGFARPLFNTRMSPQFNNTSWLDDQDHLEAFISHNDEYITWYS